MSRRAAPAVLASLLLAGPTSTAAQINFSNFLEARVGKDPADVRLDVPDNRLTYFDQFNLDFYYGDNLSLGFRFETFSASEDRELDYDEFVHRHAAWNSEWIDARIGNYQALFGRGLVLRAFELTGVVREELGQQFGDSRDLDGVKVRLHRGAAEVVALTGKPRLANEPPDLDRSKNILVSGAVASTEVSTGVRIGAEYLRLDFTPIGDTAKTSEVVGGFVQLGFDRWLRRTGLDRLSLDTYVEVARATGLVFSERRSSTKIDPDRGRGFYFAQTASIGDVGLRGLRVGASWEYKDYQNFLLGEGVNEPPPLVREHPYVLLNRNTHVLNPMQEEGYQFESRLDYRRRASLVLNWSRAETPPLPALPDDPPRTARFEEFYAELTGRARGVSVSAFAGDSQDGTRLLFERRTYGLHTVVPIRGPHSVELEYEQLTGIERRRTTDDVDFKDNYVAFTYAWAGRFSVSAIRETSDNPDSGSFDPDTSAFERRAFESVSGSVRLGNHHELVAFWGARRGGLQCTAGTCYNVPAFDGVLTQLVSRF
jgi:hypothetical protein